MPTLLHSCVHQCWGASESSIVTSNGVLSVLAVDYPAERITGFVSDDGTAMLTLETLCETRKWVPFCRKFNIESRSPESFFFFFFLLKVDYLSNSTSSKFSKEWRLMKVIFLVKMLIFLVKIVSMILDKAACLFNFL